MNAADTGDRYPSRYRKPTAQRRDLGPLEKLFKIVAWSLAWFGTFLVSFLLILSLVDEYCSGGDSLPGGYGGSIGSVTLWPRCSGQGWPWPVILISSVSIATVEVIVGVRSSRLRTPTD